MAVEGLHLVVSALALMEQAVVDVGIIPYLLTLATVGIPKVEQGDLGILLSSGDIAAGASEAEGVLVDSLHSGHVVGMD